LTEISRTTELFSQNKEIIGKYWYYQNEVKNANLQEKLDKKLGKGRGKQQKHHELSAELRGLEQQ